MPDRDVHATSERTGAGDRAIYEVGAAVAGGINPAPRREIDGFRPANLDLLLTSVIAIGLPVATAGLFDWTGGALASLALYYIICCVWMVRWRRGGLDSHWPAVWPWAIFLPSLLLPVAIAFINLEALPDDDAPLVAILSTLVVWGGLNAACEQLSWFYVLDAWRFRWRRGPLRWLGLAIGLILVLVGLIHALFWAKFLPIAEPTALTRFSIPLNLALTVAYYWLYRRSGSIWPVFVVHFLVDAQLVWIARYSILPDL